MTIWAILPAAGIGRRMGSTTPKQYLTVAGKPVLQRSIERLCAVPAISGVIVVLHPEDEHFNSLAVADSVETVSGGDERQESVRNAMEHLSTRAQPDDWVLVHDAARPCVLVSDINLLLQEAADHPVGALLAVPQDNTLKLADETGHVSTTIDRTNYWQAYTPQLFRYGLLATALADAASTGRVITDEASAVEALGKKPLLVMGDRYNIKITHESDLALAELIIQMQESNHD